MSRLPELSPDDGVTLNHGVGTMPRTAAFQLKVPVPPLLTATEAWAGAPREATPVSASALVDTRTTGVPASATVYVTLTVCGELVAA